MAFEKLIDETFVPKISAAEERLIDQSDFPASLKISLETNLSKILNSLTDQNVTELSSEVIAKILLLCGEHSSSNFWTSPTSMKTSFGISKSIREKLKCGNNFEVLTLDEDRILKAALAYLDGCPLSEKEWRTRPGARISLIWMMHHFTRPNLGPRVGSFLPFCLRFMDHWEQDYVLQGLLCLELIVSQTPRSELNRFGRDALIKDVLAKKILLTEPKIVDESLNIFTKLLEEESVAKKAEISTRNSFPFDEKDELVQKIFENSDLAVDLELKIVYLKHLAAVFRSQIYEGQRIRRWLVRLSGSLSQTLSCYQDENVLSAALEIWSVVFDKLDSDALQYHTKDIAESLIRLEFDLTKSENVEKFQTVREKCESCLKRLAESRPREMKILLKDAEKIKVNAAFDKIITDIVNS